MNAKPVGLVLNAGDIVEVEYVYGKRYTGTVLWTERHSGLEWATVRPHDAKFISTFGSSRDMHNGYKSYIYNDAVLGHVFPTK